MIFSTYFKSSELWRFQIYNHFCSSTFVVRNRCYNCELESLIAPLFAANMQWVSATENHWVAGNDVENCFHLGSRNMCMFFYCNVLDDLIQAQSLLIDEPYLSWFHHLAIHTSSEILELNIQSCSKLYIILHKPYVNGVTLREQNPSWKMLPASWTLNIFLQGV